MATVQAAITIQQAWRSRPNRHVALLRLINSEAAEPEQRGTIGFRNN